MCDCGLEQKIEARIAELEVNRDVFHHEIKELKDLLLLTASTTQVISFETEHDRSKGFSLLMASGLSFHGLGKNKFVVTAEQSLLLQAFKINYKRVDEDASQSSSQGDTRP